MTAKAFVADYLNAVWVQRRKDDVDRFVAPDLIQHNPNLPDGAAPLKAFLGKLWTCPALVESGWLSLRPVVRTWPGL